MGQLVGLPADQLGVNEAGDASTDARFAAISGELTTFEDQLDYDIERTLARAVELEASAAELGDVALCQRARLLQAAMWRRAGDLAASARACWEVNAWALEHDHRPLLSRSYAQLSISYQSLGDAAAVLEYAVCAADFLDDSTAPRARAICLMRLGDALAIGGSLEAARERYAQAEGIATASDDVDVQIVILNNLAYTDQSAGDAQRSWVTIQRLRDVVAAAGQPFDSDLLDTVARAEIALGRYADAERTAQLSIEQYQPTSVLHDAASLAEWWLTLAVAQRHMGALDKAQESLDACITLSAERDLAAVRVRAIQEQAELHAACGEPGRAFSAYKDFHAAYQELASAQRESQARNRQVMFEVAEARQEAERFREQARLDPLTGLRNRRYVGEQLPVLLDRSIRTGAPVTVAILDLDHFKGINDGCSHEIGDQVLVAFAGLLADAAHTGARRADTTEGAGFAARLGGEEFLLVITDVAPADAVCRLDELRCAVADHPWAAITGGMAVTVSVGVTVARPDSTQTGLLRRADLSLYTAKRSGRNRVCLDPPAAIAERRGYRDLASRSGRARR
ncbi:MAG TPA: GGDEF domain-containing protein [Catenuloplanes sp.]